MNIKALAIAAIMALAAPFSAQAVTLDLSGLGTGGIGNSVDVDFGGVTGGVTVSGFKSGSAANIAAGSQGIGIAGAPLGSFTGEAEEFRISFDTFFNNTSFSSITIQTLTLLTRGTPGQDFIFGATGSTQLGTLTTDPGNSALFTLPSAITISLGETFSVIGVFTDADQAGSSDPLGIRLSALEATAVPLPAPVLMLISGIAGLGFMARRRRAAATA